MTTIPHDWSAPLTLNSGWTVAQIGGDLAAPLSVPGNVHSALLDQGLIPDPYWRDTESSLC